MTTTVATRSVAVAVVVNVTNSVVRIFPRPSVSDEAIDVGFFPPDSLPRLSAGHDVRVPFILRQLQGLESIPFFDVGANG